MIKHKILLPGGTVLSSGTGTANAIRSVKLTEQVNDQTDLCPGAACAACAELELWAPGNSLEITQGDVLTLFRVDSASGNEEQIGIFLAEKPVKSSANVYKVTAYDRMTLLDKDLSPWLQAQQSAFPMALADFIRAVCGQCGVVLADGTLDCLPNADYQVRAFSNDDLTGRQLIQWAAQASCCFARMTPDGLLAFAWYTENAVTGIFPDAAEHWVALDLSGQILACADGTIWTYGQDIAPYFSASLTYEDYETAPIDKVQIKQSDDDVGVIWPEGETGTNALVIQGNPLLTTDSTAALQPVARALYERLQRVNYIPLEVSLPCTMDMPAPGQIITVTDAYGRPLQMYIMQRIITGQKVTLKSTGNARRDGTAAINEQKYTNLDGKILEIKTSVDGLSVKAANLQDDYTQLTQTVDGLELTVVKDGEVRTAFAADSTSVTISSGVISFESNSITIDSDNFKLEENGDVTATGSFSSNNGVVGSGRNEVIVSSGSIEWYRTLNNGEKTISAELYSEGSNAAMSNLKLYGSGGITMLNAYSDFDGMHFVLNDGNGSGMITMSPVNGGSAQFNGNVDVQGPNGLGVSRTINCTTLNAWGSKNRAVPTSMGNVKMAAFETPEPCFADSGSAQLDADGQCLIVPDPVYAETIDSLKHLRWLVTPTAEGAAWVEIRDGCVMVHGTPGLTFDWLCIGTQRGYSGVYAERCYDAPPAETPRAMHELDRLQNLDAENQAAAGSMLDGYNGESCPAGSF